jgi:hypothetical protein
MSEKLGLDQNVVNNSLKALLQQDQRGFMTSMTQIATEVKDEIRGKVEPLSREDALNYVKIFFEADITGKKKLQELAQ